MIQPTSQQAYFTEVLPTLADRHQEVLKYLATVEDATNSEISEALKWSINRVTGRIFELREKGLVEEATERKCKITTRNVKAWRVVKKQAVKDPKNYRCYKCSKTAVTYLEDKPVCLDHSKKKVAQAGMF
jgi:predicted ArsR family transcriptional regulator